MKKFFALIIMGLLFGCSFVVLAEEEAGHFKGKPSETLEAALSNFSEYNNKLSEILKKEELNPLDMQNIHELTYTLENALKKINEDMIALADLLEVVHVNSESGDTMATQSEGLRYVDRARQIIQ